MGADHVRVGAAPARVIACGSAEGPDDLAVLETVVPPTARPVWLEVAARTGEACVVAGFYALKLKKSWQYYLKPVTGTLGTRTVGYAKGGGGSVAGG